MEEAWPAEVTRAALPGATAAALLVERRVGLREAKLAGALAAPLEASQAEMPVGWRAARPEVKEGDSLEA